MYGTFKRERATKVRAMGMGNGLLEMGTNSYNSNNSLRFCKVGSLGLEIWKSVGGTLLHTNKLGFGSLDFFVINSINFQVKDFIREMLSLTFIPFLPLLIFFPQSYYSSYS